MNKVVFFAILALSINAVAQNNQLISRPLGNFRGRMELKEKKPTDRNLGQPFNHQASNPSTLIPLYDSIFKWQWDSLSNGWKIYSKTVNMVYDDYHNLTSGITQHWNGNVWVNSEKNSYSFDAHNNEITKLIRS